MSQTDGLMLEVLTREKLGSYHEQDITIYHSLRGSNLQSLNYRCTEKHHLHDWRWYGTSLYNRISLLHG